MGSSLAPALAKVFLSKIEREFVINSANPLGMLFYYRFVDDILSSCQKMLIRMKFYKNLIDFIKI